MQNWCDRPIHLLKVFEYLCTLFRRKINQYLSQSRLQPLPISQFSQKSQKNQQPLADLGRLD
ncbi:MAG: hypothetical protein ACLFM4_08460 [Phormidium sp.]